MCGRGERLALALAREQINGIIEVPAKARVEVDIFELQRDSQYETTDTSERGHEGCGVRLRRLGALSASLGPPTSSARLVFCLYLPLRVYSAFSPETVLPGEGRWGKYQA